MIKFLTKVLGSFAGIVLWFWVVFHKVPVLLTSDWFLGMTLLALSVVLPTAYAYWWYYIRVPSKE